MSSCVDTTGSYECHCLAGFTELGEKCYDVDECAASIHTCDKNAACINTKGKVPNKSFTLCYTLRITFSANIPKKILYSYKIMIADILIDKQPL